MLKRFCIVARFGKIKGIKSSVGNLVNLSTAMSFEEEKGKYLKMGQDEKRKLFQSSNITSLDSVPSWPDYCLKNKDNLKHVSSEDCAKDYSGLDRKISIWQGDITTLEVDAIVNAANSTLMGGGGVDGAIHKAAGTSLKEECGTLGGCKVGEAKITGGYKLLAKYVIHTVGPRGEKPEELQQCYLNSLKRAKENGIRTIAFPCISTGIYGYPQKPAAEVALSTVMNFLKENDEIDRVIFCLFLPSDKEIYEELLQKYLGNP